MTFNELKQKVRDASDAPTSPALEDLCDACGAPACDCPGLTSIRAPHPTNYAYKSAGFSRIRLCAKCWGSTAEECIQAIRARRRSIAQPAEEFKVGDEVSHAIASIRGRVVGPMRSDGQIELEAIAGSGPHFPVGSRSFALPTNLRLIRRAPQAEVKPVELCACGKPASEPDPHNEGDCPNEFCGDCYLNECERLKAAKPDPYRATMIAQCQHLNGDLMRGFCPDCGASSKEVVASRPGTEKRMINYLKWHDQQNSIAATRAERDAKKRAQALKDLDRPAHPPSFPEGAFHDAWSCDP